jgi:hypothetical protein
MSDAGSTPWIDPAAAAEATRRWEQHGEELHRSAFDLEHVLDSLALGEHLSAVRDLTHAATELWTAAAFLRRAVAAVETADTSFDPASPAFVRDLLAAVAVGSNVSDGAAPRFSSAFGDPGGRGERDLRTPYPEPAPGGTPAERARHRVVRALADTAHTRRIRPDEFGLVHLDSGRFLLVLPGVVDLSAFDLGWDRHHRSARDLDRAALGSSRSTRLADNPYARAVRDTLAGAGVPRGAELMIVGHSFGADTALDLAADPAVNGSDGYRITHVVAAGYHSAPQLGAVPGDTAVLVVQNRRDVPVIAEAVGSAGVTEAVTSSANALVALAGLDPILAARHQARSFAAQFRALTSAVAHVVDRRDDVVDVAVGVAAGDPGRVADGVGDFVTLEPGVRTAAPGRIVSVFEGGGGRFGHDPDHYVQHLLAVDDPAVIGFLESVDAAGYTAPGLATAVDVSVPA